MRCEVHNMSSSCRDFTFRSYDIINISVLRHCLVSMKYNHHMHFPSSSWFNVYIVLHYILLNLNLSIYSFRFFNLFAIFKLPRCLPRSVIVLWNWMRMYYSISLIYYLINLYVAFDLTHLLDLDILYCTRKRFLFNLTGLQ